MCWQKQFLKVLLKVSNIYLGLGSNQGNRENNLFEAIDLISKIPLNNMNQSNVIETEPYGYKKQENFLNMVVEGETKLSPQELLTKIKQIETAIGRKKTFHWGPRIIDIDILFYDDLILNKKELTIPHPDIENRLFVLAPMAEIAPTYIHPILKKTMIDLYQKFVA
jgi:dihydroneopterin aldolase / 2-amino-4-hydroxy-6-hydroxymethyldihydropteridine diphosphokinase